VALQIPPLGNDGLSHPDWGGAPLPGRLSVAAGRLADTLALLEGAAAPDPAVLEGLRRLGARGAAADLLVAADHRSILLLLDGRRVPLGAAARDAVLALLERRLEPRGAAAPVADAADAARSPVDPADAARAAAIQALVGRARSQGAGALPRATAPAQQAWALQRPLLAGADPDPAAALAAAVESSGLFLEAHVAQWLDGARTLDQLRDEQAAPAAGTAGEPRAAAQLDALQRQAIALSGEAWSGQPVQWLIERAGGRHRDAPDPGHETGLFQATVRLDLRHLGGLQARIRVVEGTVGVQIEAEHPGSFAAAMPRLADALDARGLQVVALGLEAAAPPDLP